MSVSEPLKHSVTEMMDYLDCTLKWEYRYDRRLRLKEPPGRLPALASGTAVHYVVEMMATQHPEELPVAKDVEALVKECLESEFENSTNPEAQLHRFTPGVIRAVERVPDEIWKHRWQVEKDLELTLPYLPYAGQSEDDIAPDFMLIGRPDMFRHYVDDEGNEFIEIVDIKTTAHKPLEYMLWSPQIRYYALMLQRIYVNAQITYRYVCVPTTNSPSRTIPDVPAWAFTPRQHDQAENELRRVATLMLEQETFPHYSRMCDWCDFKAACATTITGGDADSYVADNYVTRPVRGTY